MLDTKLDSTSILPNENSVKIKPRQEELAIIYELMPEEATVLDYAATDCNFCPADDAIHSCVITDKNHNVVQDVSVHSAVGGYSDAPTPGDILCAAIASCFDTAIRVIANRYGLKLRTLKIEVTGFVDVRGTLQQRKGVPVRFSVFDLVVHIEMKSTIQNMWIDRLIRGAKKAVLSFKV